MDGPWQIGHKTADEYGRLAAEAAKLMKWVDPSIELVACGSSGAGMKTFGEWEMTVLDHTYDFIDYISLHSYYGNAQEDTPNYLARAEAMDRFIKDAAALCDAVKAKKHHPKTMYLSFDEWNVWYRTKSDFRRWNVFSDPNAAKNRGDCWQIAPHLLEEIYNFEDALLVGCLLMTLQNNCDRVKMACLAQLVNVIAPIMTEDGGKAWVQTIFYPFMYASLYGRGTALRPIIECDSYQSSESWQIPYLSASVIHDEQTGEVTVFAVNRSLTEELELDIDLENFTSCRLAEHVELHCEDLKAVNTKDEAPVVPASRPVNADGPVVLKKHSWNMLRFRP
jgi:alpha-N-arabinofuranosidase